MTEAIDCKHAGTEECQDEITHSHTPLQCGGSVLDCFEVGKENDEQDVPHDTKESDEYHHNS